MATIRCLGYFVLIGVFISACADENNEASSVSATDNAVLFDQIVEDFSADYRSLKMPDLQLSFVDNLQALGSVGALQLQKGTFEKHSAVLATVNSEELDLCSRIDLSIMKAEIAFGVRRAKLGLRFLEHEADISNAKRLSDIPLGLEWYQFYLDRWNGADLEPDDIYAFGEQELRRSVANYDAIQRDLGFEGDDIGLAQHLSTPQSRIDGGKEITDLFKTKQNQVWQNLTLLFPQTYGVEHSMIARSDRGESFPAPGYYEPDKKTFYYNLIEDGFEVRQADWLFLHEGTPGHHFQINAETTGRRCARRLPETFHAAYVEGWAAYVETLGEDLGLYQTPEAKLAAVEWDMVRSVRVVLDVGINAYNWSDEEALSYWRNNVRGQQDIAQREIDRMKRWPAQVITYKYGANVFETAKTIAVSSNNEPATYIEFHDAVISYGSMPLETFRALHLELSRHSDSESDSE